MITDLLRLMRQIIGINADAMSAHKARTEREEIPFCPRGLENGFCVDSHSVKENSQFVNKRDINIPLSVFNHLCRFGHFDRGSEMCSRCDNGTVNGVDSNRHLWSRPGRNLFYMLNGMLFISRIDSFGGVSTEKVNIESQPRKTLKHRNTILLGRSWIHRAFVDDNVAFLKHTPNCFTCSD